MCDLRPGPLAAGFFWAIWAWPEGAEDEEGIVVSDSLCPVGAMTMSEIAVRQTGADWGRKAMRPAPDHGMLPSLKRDLPFCEPMDEGQVAKMDDASMSIPDEVGVIFRDEIAPAGWKRDGAKVEGDHVFRDRGHVRELTATFPAGWTFRARNPDRNLPFDGKHAIFVPMTGAPSSSETSRFSIRPSSLAARTRPPLSHPPWRN
jgi:trimethylamine:corrinoid methyltransferase-like protein